MIYAEKTPAKVYAFDRDKVAIWNAKSLSRSTEYKDRLVPVQSKFSRLDVELSKMDVQ